MSHIPLTEDQEDAFADLFLAHGEANGIGLVMDLIRERYGNTHVLMCDIRTKILPLNYEKMRKFDEKSKKSGLDDVLLKRVV
jgi:hypothetical protein